MDETKDGFTQVIAALGPGQWNELVRVGSPPLLTDRETPSEPGRLESLLAWLPKPDHARVRSAMQVVRLGAPPQRWRNETAGLTVMVSGGPWRGGQWAYAVRAWQDAAPVPPTASAPASATAPVVPRDPASDDAAEVGMLDYDPALDRLTMDDAACRMHGLPPSLGMQVPMTRWAACFVGDDGFVAISRLCWSAPSERPSSVTLRLAGGERRIELSFEQPTPGGVARARCRLKPAG